MFQYFKEIARRTGLIDGVELTGAKAKALFFRGKKRFAFLRKSIGGSAGNSRNAAELGKLYKTFSFLDVHETLTR